MPIPEYTLVGAFRTQAITIPADGAAASLRTLLAQAVGLQRIKSPGCIVIGVRLEQIGANFNWGEAANRCLALHDSADAYEPPIYGDGTLDTFVESTNGITIAAVAVVYFDV